MTSQNNARIEQIAELFARRGHSEYGGEAVSQLEHALQCASLAEAEGAEPTLILAALLHDIGHLLHDLSDDAPERGVDDHHETAGYRFLLPRFDPAVVQPVRLHVTAKRYLCRVDRAYQAALSAPSLLSLNLQGGPMSAEEADAFEATAFWQEAVRLRRWDDQAKVVGARTPQIDHFLSSYAN